MIDEQGRQRATFVSGETAVLRCSVRFDTRVERPTVGFVFRDRLGNDVFGTNTYHAAPIAETCVAGDELEVEFEIELNLGPGRYTVTMAVHSEATHLVENYDWWDKVMVFEVMPGPPPHFVGTARLPVRVVARGPRRAVLVAPSGGPWPR
jgi:lipopolysaccharide transport system ATP-binding protein